MLVIAIAVGGLHVVKEASEVYCSRRRIGKISAFTFGFASVSLFFAVLFAVTYVFEFANHAEFGLTDFAVIFCSWLALAIGIGYKCYVVQSFVRESES